MNFGNQNSPFCFSCFRWTFFSFVFILFNNKIKRVIHRTNAWFPNCNEKNHITHWEFLLMSFMTKNNTEDCCFYIWRIRIFFILIFFLSFGLGSELEKGRTRKSLVCWVYYFLKFLDFNPRVWTEFDKMNLIADQLVKLIKFNRVNIKIHSNWKSTKIRHQITIYQINLLGRVNFNQG